MISDKTYDWSRLLLFIMHHRLKDYAGKLSAKSIITKNDAGAFNLFAYLAENLLSKIILPQLDK